MNSLVNPLTVWEMEGSFGLHPDVRQSRSKWKGFEATVRVGTVLGGDFWPLLSRDGETFASRLPTDAIELRGRVKGVERDAVRSCRLNVRPELVLSDDDPLSARETRRLLEDTADGYEELAARYANSTEIRNVVRAAIEGAPEASRAFTNACIAMARVCDPALWPSLAARATTNFVAEACLRDIPDARGVEFFGRAFDPNAPLPMGRPLLGNALAFHVLCCSEQGIFELSTRFGKPFLEKAPDELTRYARLLIGEVHQSAFDAQDFETSAGWREYIAAALLVEKINKDEAWIASMGLTVLRRYLDPRTPIVTSRLIRDRVCASEDVVPGLTSVKTRDAMRETLALLADTKEARKSAKGARGEELEQLEALLEESERVLTAAGRPP